MVKSLGKEVDPVLGIRLAIVLVGFNSVELKAVAVVADSVLIEYSDSSSTDTTVDLVVDLIIQLVFVAHQC